MYFYWPLSPIQSSYGHSVNLILLLTEELKLADYCINKRHGSERWSAACAAIDTSATTSSSCSGERNLSIIKTSISSGKIALFFT